MKPASGRVLIADDDPHVREMLREFLAGRGYEVATAATGGQAIDAVPTFQPDVILIDRLMPDLSGTDVLDALHRAGTTVPVILISGHHQATAREGFFGVLSKPFKLRRRAEVVAAAMGPGRTPGCLTIAVPCCELRTHPSLLAPLPPRHRLPARGPKGT